MYIHQLKDWPDFTWDLEALSPVLGTVRHRQGKILGQMSALGFELREKALLETLTADVVKSSEIEGERLNEDQVRSSIARRLGIALAGAVPAERNVEGVVEMMLDATQNYSNELNTSRLFDWHAALFPTGRSGMQKITVAEWRGPDAGPMQVGSGPMGRERIHFEAPTSERLQGEMEKFLNWFNVSSDTDPVVKAAVAHIWFVTIHPFDDGNGRITRAITDMQLARADESPLRFYSISAEILKERPAYYEVLERTQKGGLDITTWIKWFLECLNHSMDQTEQTMSAIMQRKAFWEKHRETVFNPRQQKMIAVLLDDFFGSLNTSKWAKITKSSADTALRDIQDLLNKGVLEKTDAGGRSTSYTLINT
ncbi:Fic family protein [Pedobacter sp. BMA]|uniref:Fic family protein n=1 Tax=Pedobacter sp. BMA TaxID=1663685 RepID=UPI00064B5E27|nr:Fic family protein [Pedobacter sp. BMA]KLT64496.1 cell division protein Fic [Pedobacter sp. BMA]